jgi:hypothetical protein
LFGLAQCITDATSISTQIELSFPPSKNQTIVDLNSNLLKNNPPRFVSISNTQMSNSQINQFHNNQCIPPSKIVEYKNEKESEKKAIVHKVSMSPLKSGKEVSSDETNQYVTNEELISLMEELESKGILKPNSEAGMDGSCTYVYFPYKFCHEDDHGTKNNAMQISVVNVSQGNILLDTGLSGVDKQKLGCETIYSLTEEEGKLPQQAKACEKELKIAKPKINQNVSFSPITKKTAVRIKSFQSPFIQPFSPYLSPFTASKTITPGKYLYFPLHRYDQDLNVTEIDQSIFAFDVTATEGLHCQNMEFRKISDSSSCKEFLQKLEIAKCVSFELVFRRYVSY